MGPELEGVRPMDKLDLPVLFIAYLLRLTQLFLLLYARISTRLYDYWFNTCDAKFLMSDLLRWFVFVLSTAFYLMLHASPSAQVDCCSGSADAILAIPPFLAASVL